MDLTVFGLAEVAVITAICYLIGLAASAAKMEGKWIPVLVGACGMVLGCICLALGMPDFPARDVITAAAVGTVSGLAATGIDQIGRQFAGGEQKDA